jgi:hypothetical protein
MKHIILVRTDSSCEMAEVYLDGELVMNGNYWDFHNGCHGIYKYGEFNSVDGLVRKISRSLSPELVEVNRETYNCQE